MIDRRLPDPDGAAPRGRRWFLTTAGVAAVATLGATTFAAGAASGSGTGTAGGTSIPNEIDIGFCTDMSAHHEQALAMCQRVLGTDTGGEVQAAAAEILQNQSYERGLMHAWLQSWGESTAPPDEVMAWMGMAVPIEMMPGLATDAEMLTIATHDGFEKGRLFLTLMRDHHVGGVHMAQGAASASTEQVRELATRMAAIQTYEIEVFDQLLATTYRDT